MEELKHDPYSDAGNTSVVMYEECGWTEEGKAHVDELMEHEKAEGLQLANELSRRFGSHERLPELLDLAHEYQGWAWLTAVSSEVAGRAGLRGLPRGFAHCAYNPEVASA